jgi:hypothetical protein
VVAPPRLNSATRPIPFEEHLNHVIRYTDVAAQLCTDAKDWPFGSAGIGFVSPLDTRE